MYRLKQITYYYVFSWVNCPNPIFPRQWVLLIKYYIIVCWTPKSLEAKKVFDLLCKLTFKSHFILWAMLTEHLYKIVCIWSISLHYPFTNKALKVIGIFTILVIYPYLTSDAVEPFTNWTFELVQVIRNKTPSFTIRSLAVEWIFGRNLSFFQRFLLVFLIHGWCYKLK